MVKYRFAINGVGVNPLYDDELSKSYETEGNEIFHRTILDGKLKFIKDDYNYIYSQPFDTEFVVLCQMYRDNEWVNYVWGKFYKTDCNWDEDNKTIEVSLDTKDYYEDIIANLDTEYDLIKIAPKTSRMKVDKRPILQIYSNGSNTVSSIVGGSYYEQEVVDVPSNDKLSSCYFSPILDIKKVVIWTDYQNFDNIYYTKTGGYLYSKNGLYNISIENTSTPDGYEFVLRRISDNTIMYKSQEYIGEFIPDSIEFTLYPYDPSVTQELECVWLLTKIWGRYLLNKSTGFPFTTHTRPIEDIIEYNRNFQYVASLPDQTSQPLFEISVNTQIEPTEYGINQKLEYYINPLDLGIPVAKSTWDMVSVWVNPAELPTTSGVMTYILKDAYTIADVIKTLLKQFSNVTHEATSEYSQFLYGEENPILDMPLRLLLTPKSNMIAGEYDFPAKKALITISDVFEMLKNVFKCYWYIEDNKLKIEHINYFRNGYTYGTSQIGTDLSILSSPKLGKKWGYDINKYTYDKQNMPQRYEFSWMDDVTTSFNGYPIEIISNYIQKGRTEKIQISKFTSDVDSMLGNGNSMNLDGFALLYGTYISEDDIYKTEYYTFKNDIIMQNGYASFVFLHQYLYIYDLPAKNVKINEVNQQVLGIQKNKKQTVVYPSMYDPDIKKLVVTNLGNGQIEKISINLSSRNNEIVLKYDTE